MAPCNMHDTTTRKHVLQSPPVSWSFRQIPVVARDASRSIEVGRGGGGGAAVGPQCGGGADGAPEIEKAVEVMHI